MSVCETNDCTKPATARVFWPSRPPYSLCMLCTERARGVSEAMGFYLHIEDVGHKEPTHDTQE